MGCIPNHPVLKNNVLNEERRRAILEMLGRNGRVLVTEMAHQFDTSQVTIRKDLEALHAQRLVHRTHGGALPAREGALEDPAFEKKNSSSDRRSSGSLRLRHVW